MHLSQFMAGLIAVASLISAAADHVGGAESGPAERTTKRTGKIILRGRKTGTMALPMALKMVP